MSTQTQGAPAVLAVRHRKAAKAAIRAAKVHAPAITKDPKEAASCQEAIEAMLNQLTRGGGDESLLDSPDADDEDSDGPGSLDN